MRKGLPDWILALLRAPVSGLPITQKDGVLRRSDGTIVEAPEGIPCLVYPAELSGSDAEFNRFYEWFAPLYAVSERILGWLLTGIRIGKGRRQMVELVGLQKGMRLLEVSPGPGVSHRLLRRAIGKKAEAAAVDLSQAMLRQCRKRHARQRFVLIRANAQHLPFADNSFDALYHFGGINLFNEPGQALLEFARVVRPGGIVAWGDEEMSPNYKHWLGRRVLPKMNPGFLKTPPPPPAGLKDLVKHEIYGGLGYLYVGRKAVQRDSATTM